MLFRRQLRGDLFTKTVRYVSRYKYDAIKTIRDGIGTKKKKKEKVSAITHVLYYMRRVHGGRPSRNGNGQTQYNMYGRRRALHADEIALGRV